ncbi:hypothetical protein PF215_00885 [Staphylococcus pseudintermedius]
MIIIPGWQPHLLFDTFEMKMLDDPNNDYGNEKIHIDLVYYKDFKDEHLATIHGCYMYYERLE